MLMRADRPAVNGGYGLVKIVEARLAPPVSPEHALNPHQQWEAVQKKRFEEGKSNESMERYWAFKNAWSMDGMPGMKAGLSTAKAEHIVPIKKMVGPLAPSKYTAGVGWNLQQVLLIALLSFLIGLATAFYGPTVRQMALEAAGQSKAELSFSNLTHASFYREIVSNK